MRFCRRHTAKRNAIPALDYAVETAFRKAGCRVVRIDCAGVWRLGGSLHCLVNVVARR